MPKSLLIPALDEKTNQAVYVEGTHTPDELARASGVWIAATGSAMLPVGAYNMCDVERWMWFAVENGLVQVENDEVSYSLRGGDCCMMPPGTRGPGMPGPYRVTKLRIFRERHPYGRPGADLALQVNFCVVQQGNVLDDGKP